MMNLADFTPPTGDVGLPTWVIPVGIAAIVVLIACVVIPLINNSRKGK